MQQSRLDKAKLIIDRPGDFKVCEACGSIVSLTTAVCPNCNAYRFDSNTEYVVEQAVLLASRGTTFRLHRKDLGNFRKTLPRSFPYAFFRGPGNCAVLRKKRPCRR